MSENARKLLFWVRNGADAEELVLWLMMIDTSFSSENCPYVRRSLRINVHTKHIRFIQTRNDLHFVYLYLFPSLFLEVKMFILR